MFLEYKFGCLGLSFVPGEKSPLLEKEMAFVHQDTFECAQTLFVNISHYTNCPCFQYANLAFVKLGFPFPVLYMENAAPLKKKPL